MKKIGYAVLVLSLFSCTTREEVIEQTFPDGSKKIVMTYEGSDEKKHRVAQTSYYENGAVEVKGRFDDKGLREGKWVYYYTNEKAWSECEYQGGKKHGISTVYYENGQKRYEGKYENDKQVGKWMFWKDNGELISEKTY